jgi:hypothetical protein
VPRDLAGWPIPHRKIESQTGNQEAIPAQTRIDWQAAPFAPANLDSSSELTSKEKAFRFAVVQARDAVSRPEG